MKQGPVVEIAEDWDGDLAAAPAVYRYRGRLWRAHAPVCLACASRDPPARRTLVAVRGEKRVICLTHGELETLTFVVRSRIAVRLGKTRRDGERTSGCRAWVPKTMSAEARARFVDEALEVMLGRGERT